MLISVVTSGRSTRQLSVGKHYCYAGHLCQRTPSVRNSPCSLSFPRDVRMFDHIDQPPQVPLYPAKRPLHPRAQWMSYSVGHSPDVGPNLSRPHGLPPPSMPPSPTFKARGEGPYSLSSINDSDERGVAVGRTNRSYARAGKPVSGRVEMRRPIHPYDDNGAGGWRASAVESTARKDVERGNYQPPPRRLFSPGQHASQLCVNAAVYPQRKSDPSHGDGARVRKHWSQDAVGELNTDTGSSAAAAAAPAPPGSITKRARGPAWGGAIRGAWN